MKNISKNVFGSREFRDILREMSLKLLNVSTFQELMSGKKNINTISKMGEDNFVCKNERLKMRDFSLRKRETSFWAENSRLCFWSY